DDSDSEFTIFGKLNCQDLAHTGTNLGFFGAGFRSRGSATTLSALLTLLDDYGLILNA
ncbi:hypothetical protein LCGC14_1544390, partial [marine sediment metagenome]